MSGRCCVGGLSFAEIHSASLYSMGLSGTLVSIDGKSQIEDCSWADVGIDVDAGLRDDGEVGSGSSSAAGLGATIVEVGAAGDRDATVCRMFLQTILHPL